jgi:hypothetical protein
MNIELDKAREILNANGYTCVLFKDSKEYHSEKRGVAPLIEFLESGADFGGFCAADRTVGLGAAHLYLLLGVRAVWARVISFSARNLLEKSGVFVSFENEVPFIINREGNGACPIEAAVVGTSSSADALKKIKETLEKLKNV